MLLSAILCATLQAVLVKGLVISEALHDFMTEPELAYYFDTGNRALIPDYQIVYLPINEAVVDGEFEEDLTEIDYNFSAFDRPIHLKLKRNNQILPTRFKSYAIEENDHTPLARPSKNCHYIHNDDASVAAMSFCDPKSMRGLVVLPNTTLEIHPLTERLKAMIKMREPLLENNFEENVPHLVKRANFHQGAFVSDAFPIAGNMWSVNEELHAGKRAGHRPAGGLAVELALFFDEAAYKIFAPHMGYDDGKLQDMLLAYVNGVQALYHHPSLGASLELILVRLEIMRKQPSHMPHHQGERGKLLDSFCDYQNDINADDDADPEHWDMALYVSGLDFFAYENGRKSGVTMGLAPVGGVCLNRYNCLIAELGTTNVFGKPYPSAGFNSVYILAHEIGHNLGMHHDSVGNSCPKEGYIMSPSRGTNGETLWSRCSAAIMMDLGWAKCLQDWETPKKSLDHSRFMDSPGQIYTAKRQCEILLRDKDAVIAPNQQLATICYNLQCKTPHRSGYYHAGPALEGTQCGNKNYCFGGECVAKEPHKPVKVVPGGWTSWKPGKCRSACLEKSKGYQTNKRDCNKPIPINTDAGCEGSNIEFATCNDDKICKTKRMSVIDYASEKCAEFSKLLPELDKNGAGLQAPHEDGRVWMGCAVFCRRADSGSFYTPRIELNDLGVSPYFPDGTWCHRQDGLNYYCLHHHCLPENFQFGRNAKMMDEIGEDVPFSQNAHPQPDVPNEIKQYLSLNPNGKPIKNKLRPDVFKPREEDWETDDYVVIPNLKLMQQESENDADDDDSFNFIS